jgi:hypothetical protein
MSREKIIEAFQRVMARDHIARNAYEEAVLRGKGPSDVFLLMIIALSDAREKLFEELLRVERGKTPERGEDDE